MTRFLLNPPPYIVPIGYFKSSDNPTYIGTGFIVKNHLITAAHVVKDCFFSKSFALINGKPFFICNFNCKLYFNDVKEKIHYDFAIITLRVDPFLNRNYSQNDFFVNSPLLLSDKLPLVGNKVINKFWMDAFASDYYEENDNEVCDFPFTSLPEFLYPRWDTSFTIKHSGRITHGSSGSPVLIENKVIGIVTNGLDKQNIEKYNLPLDYLYYCECLRVDVLKSQFPELFG